MEKVSVEGKSVEVKLNSKIYCYDCALKTKDAFKKLCRVFVKKNDDFIFVALKPKRKIKNTELEILGYEFCNHLLNTMKEKNTGLI